MGDGVLVYVGYPYAHEDDAERAVRAGLALVEAVGKLRPQGPLQARIGVATGLVVVGDLVGSGEAQERGVVGETPNVAARLQGIAAPDTVVIAEGTRRLLGDLFELEDLGAVDLKGLTLTSPGLRHHGFHQWRNPDTTEAAPSVSLNESRRHSQHAW
jgi:class 3 adenylate cyclase